MKTQIIHIRKSITNITSQISDDVRILDAEQEHVSAGQARVAAAKRLAATCHEYKRVIEAQIAVYEVTRTDLEKRVQVAESRMQELDPEGAGACSQAKVWQGFWCRLPGKSNMVKVCI